MSNGLSLVNLNVVLSQAASAERRIDGRAFRELKKTVIERQCRGLVEFVEPDHNLDLVAGQTGAKKRLQEDAQWITGGRLDLAPMGYLICGPVGTGKTFMAECYAGSIGIPCVTLKNFRSKYVGETEGNLQQVLAVLRSLGPVVVIVDEADAALGNRQSDGDSGTSSRVFSMIAAQMGNTRYRGRIVWMLLTSRPDLLPIDLKRQGRAEVHIPLFYPYEDAEIRQMFEVMARKNKLKLAAGILPQITADRKLSGADVESIVLAAKRTALHGRSRRVDQRGLGSGAEGVHSLGPRIGEGVARDGGRAGMHADGPLAAALAGEGVPARRAKPPAGADGGDPADFGIVIDFRGNEPLGDIAWRPSKQTRLRPGSTEPAHLVDRRKGAAGRIVPGGHGRRPDRCRRKLPRRRIAWSR